MRFRLFALVFAVALAMSTITAGSAFAAKGHGGGGGKGGGGTVSTATLTLAPKPAPTNSIVQVSGCGYMVGVPTEIGISSPVAAMVGTLPVDSNGCIATSIGVTVAGSYLIEVKQNPSGSWVVMASSSLTVQ